MSQSDAAAGAGAAAAGAAKAGSASASSTPSPGPIPPAAFLGPLPSSKTITMTMVPDWSSQGPASVVVVLGPAKTLPQDAAWVFELNVTVLEPHVAAHTPKRDDEEAVVKGQRALMWHGGKVFPLFSHCVVRTGCKLAVDDEFKTVSVALRTYNDENDGNAMLYTRRKLPAENVAGSEGYLRLLQGHHYYLNLTFAAGSSIAHRVGMHAWRPIVYVVTKRKAPGSDALEVTGSRVFTNFVTNWAQGVELAPDDRERKAALLSATSDAAEEAKYEELVAAGLVPPPPPPQSLSMSLFNAPAAAPASVLGRSSGAASGISAAGLTLEQSKAAAFQSALQPMNYGSVVDTTVWKTEITFHDLEWAVNDKRLHRIVLPSIDPKTPDPPFPVTSVVSRFWKPSEAPVAAVLITLEAMARHASVDPKSPACEAAKVFLSLTVTLTQLVGFQYFAVYVAQQEANTNTDVKMNTTVMDSLQYKGQALILHVCRRMEWSLGLQRKAGKAFDADLSIKLVAADKDWIADVTVFLKEAETKVTELLRLNVPKWHQFREVQRRGVPWPHSAAARCTVEAAGFTYSPMMLKRDRCVCRVCGVEVSGWRPWHDPISFHVFAKHPPSFQPPMLQSATSMAVAQLVTEANMRRPPDPPVAPAPDPTPASGAGAPVNVVVSTTADRMADFQ